jgi:hypothetical protein
MKEECYRSMRGVLTGIDVLKRTSIGRWAICQKFPSTHEKIMRVFSGSSTIISDRSPSGRWRSHACLDKSTQLQRIKE